MKLRYRQVLEEMLSLPTAPFAEAAIVQYLRRWAAGGKLEFQQDRAGNVLLHHRKGKGSPCWVLAAHMDHPGFIATGQRGTVLLVEFRGGVDVKYFPHARVRFFLRQAPCPAEAPQAWRPVVGVVRSVRKTKQSPFLACRVQLAEAVDVPPGSVGMWDFPGVRISGDKVASRCCDDVAGCAAVVCAMEEIIATARAVDVTALFTRAEEAGFVGALSASAHKSLPSEGLIVAIETSKAHAGAKLGGGVIVRVGDRTRTFDPSLTAYVAAVAQRLSQRDKRFLFSRQLMPGGTCESTAYAMFGYAATGLCVALGNYHNQGKADKVAPEQIDARDFECLVKLLVALPSDGSSPRQNDEALLHRLKGLLKERKSYLEDS